jgi:hypothetical protein
MRTYNAVIALASEANLHCVMVRCASWPALMLDMSKTHLASKLHCVIPHHEITCRTSISTLANGCGTWAVLCIGSGSF